MIMASSDIEPAQITVETVNNGNSNTGNFETTETSSDSISKISGNTVTFHSNENQYPTPTPMATTYQQNLEYWQSRQKPVKERNLKVYMIVSIIAIVAFFPVGIPAFYTAMKLKEDYYTGIEQGDLSKSIKRAAMLDKLLILSFTLCIFTVILALAIFGGLDSGGRHHSNSLVLTG